MPSNFSLCSEVFTFCSGRKNNQEGEVPHYAIPVLQNQNEWANYIPDELKSQYSANVKEGISFRNIFFEIESGEHKKIILNNVSGDIKAGSLVALMGPSGCGKTTLLDILADKKTAPYTGIVSVDGVKRSSQNRDFFKRICVYVPQDDVFHGHETVIEAVEFNASLKGDSAHMKDPVDAHHNRILLELLGIKEVSSSKVGSLSVRGISGGQKRRVTLAKGIVTASDILFLDEPTSGLSGTDAQKVVQCLKNICLAFKATVIVVIHQPKPSVLALFDQVFVLAPGGSIVYDGSVDDMSDYLSSHGLDVPVNCTAADHIIDLVTPHYGNPNQMISLFQKNYSPLVYHSEFNFKLYRDKSKYTLSLYSQFMVLFNRDWRLSLRDIDTLVMILGNSIVMGILIGLTYFRVRTEQAIQYQLACVFFVIMLTSMFALNNVPALMDDRVRFLHENGEGLYSVFPYSVSKFLTVFIWNGLATLFFCLLTFFLGDFEGKYFGYFFLVNLVGYIVVDSMTSLAAALSTTTTMANSLATAVISFLAIFNGFTANPNSIPSWLSWLCYVSPFYYMFETLTIYLFRNEPSYFCKSCQFESFEALLEFYGLEEDRIYAVDLPVLFFFFIVYRCALVLVLQRSKLDR